VISPKSCRFGFLIVLVAAAVCAQTPAGAGGEQNVSSPGQSKSSSPDTDIALQRVIAEMDRTAANFTTAQAKFVWTQYNAVVNDVTDIQKGTVYFRRKGKQVEMAADVDSPPPGKKVLFADSKVQLFEPKIDQVTQYDTGKDRATVESFLVLGFGGSGQEMLKSFDASYLGTENVNGVDAAKLDLVPKSEKARSTFSHIYLWIDPARGVSVRQKLFGQDGDYRLADYSDIRLHEKIPDSVFRLKTNDKTKFVSPRG
jgi:outer membrane lipoprotein-sorting protein